MYPLVTISYGIAAQSATLKGTRGVALERKNNVTRLEISTLINGFPSPSPRASHHGS